MNLNRLIHPDDNPDLTEERLKATFDTDVLASILKSNKKNLARSRALKDEVNKRPALSDSKPVGHMTREEKFENATRKTIELIKDIANFANPMDRLEADTVFRQVLGIEGFPLALHFLMFLPTIQNQADDEQQDWWLTKAMSMKILGTYAQTEMGHGTNLSKIETLATYDRDAEEFILHSPTTTSLKWWPGGLGNTVNHVALVANLIIDGKSYGPHIFFVQIRDLETHKALPDVKVGDIGSKMGLQSVDNGFLGFDQFRIPRRNMLMKYAKVDKNGTYHPPIHSKVTYSTMTFVRAEIVLWQSLYLMYATTIATRYSCVRRQGEIVQGEGEVKVIDYQTQQNRLFPAISKAYAYWFAAEEIRNRTTDSINNMKQNQVDEAVLADLHAASCCLKAFVTFEGSKSLEQCRMACGGHGYSEASYLPTVYTVGVATATYEGENLVLLLQTARYLMRAAAAVRNGGRLGPSVEFLRQVGQTHSLIDKVPQADYSHYLNDFEHVARKQIFAAHDRLEQLKRNGMSNEAAWTENGVEMTRASRTFARLLVARYFFATVQKIDDSRCREVIGDLLHLHLNQDVVAQAKYLLENGYMNGDQIKHIKEDVFRLYRRIRPNAVSLVDSYDVQDEELRSVLGRRDGHVYENLFKWAQQSPLNQHTDGVSPVFEKYLKLLTSDDEKSKL